MCIGLHVKCRNSCQNLMKLECSLQIFLNYAEISHFIKIRPVGAELFHADGQTDGLIEGQTDIKKLICAFRNFANAHKNCSK